MSLFLPDKDRRVIPRWRDFLVTVSTGELDGERLPSSKRAPDIETLRHKTRIWEAEHSIEAAADLVAAAIVFGEPGSALDAAQFLVAPGSTATAPVKAIADRVLGKHESDALVALEGAGSTPEPRVVHGKIHGLRRRTVATPRNSFVWVDLSLAYATIGQERQAVRAMEVAIKLGPTNRFVLRSASRLFVHSEELDRAHELLQRNTRTRHDPWLLSAEIAVASLSKKTSRLIRNGRQILSAGRHSSLETAELASALATVELTAGDVRKARPLFRQSLTDPTENAVAQAGWASRLISGVEIAPNLFQTPRSFEARAVQYYQNAKWTDAIQHCRTWLSDEPFSSRPALLGSYIAGVTQEDFHLMERFAAQGLIANRGDDILANNLVVALANQGRMEEASQRFHAITRPCREPLLEVTLQATEGLLKFRAGSPDVGRLLYLQAIELAVHLKSPKQQALAAVHLAREEIIARTFYAAPALSAAISASKGVDSPEIDHMLNRLDKLLSDSRGPGGSER